MIFGGGDKFGKKSAVRHLRTLSEQEDERMNSSDKPEEIAPAQEPTPCQSTSPEPSPSDDFEIDENKLISYLGTESEVVIPDFVTCIAENAFSYCADLESITIPSSVTIIEEYSFGNCADLKKIFYTGDIEGWCKIFWLGALMRKGDKERKLYIGGNEIMGNIVLPSTVTSIGNHAFYGCVSIASIEFPNSLTHIGREAFCGCCITDLTIPDSVTSLGMNAFCGCEQLKSVTLPRRFKKELTSIFGSSGRAKIQFNFI